MNERDCPSIRWPEPGGLETVVVLPYYMIPYVKVIAKALSAFVDEKIKEQEQFEKSVRKSPTGGL